MNWLRAFEAAARHENLTKAAGELNVTQAAVSQQVRNLEQALGVRLFRRRPRGIEPTEVARLYLPVVADAFERMRESTADLFGEREAAPLAVRCRVSFARQWLVPRLPRFATDHPDVRVRLLATSVLAPEQPLRGVDAEIRLGHGRWPGAISYRLTEERWCPVCAPSLVARLDPANGPAALAEVPLIQVVGERDGWPSWFRAAGAEAAGSTPAYEFDASTLAIAAAQSGLGVVLARSFAVADALADGSLVAAHPLSIPTGDAHYLLLPGEGGPKPRAVAFRDWVLAESAEFRARAGDRPG